MAKRGERVKIDDLILPFEDERQVRADNTLPDGAVESGKDVPDDIKKKPIEKSFTVFISPDPELTNYDAKRRNAKRKLQNLLALREAKKVFRMVTPEIVLKEAAIKNIQYVKSGNIGYQVDLTVKEIKRDDPSETISEDNLTLAGRQSDFVVENLDQHEEKVRENAGMDLPEPEPVGPGSAWNQHYGR